MILTLVVGAGIGLGLAALATLSTGQGGEAERRIKELKQTAAIQYATDYVLADLSSQYAAQTNETEKPTQVLANKKNLKSAGSSLLSTCIADMPWGPPPHNSAGAVATLWDSSKAEKDQAQLIAASATEIPGINDKEIQYAFEHYGRQLTTLTLDEDSWIEFRQLNDVAYDNVFFDIWFQVDFEDDSVFPETETNEYEIPLASFYKSGNSDPELSVYAKLSICDQDIALANKLDEKAEVCRAKQKRTRGIFTYHLKQEGGPDEHLKFVFDPDNPDDSSNYDTIKSIEDGYWQYASFNIDLPNDSAEAHFIAVPQTAFDTFDDADAEFGSLDSFEKGGIWKIGHHTPISSSAPMTIGSARFWRQLSLSSASAAAESLFESDQDEPGRFHDIASLGEPDGVLLVDGDWTTQRELPKEGSNYVREMRGSWWGAALGKPTLVTQKQGSAQNGIFEKTRQIFAHKRAANARSGPPAPTQLYRLFTCDENGGASIVETHRNLRRDDDEWNVSWEPQL